MVFLINNSSTNDNLSGKKNLDFVSYENNRWIIYLSI